MIRKFRQHKRHFVTVILSMMILCMGVLTFSVNVKAGKDDDDVDDRSLYARMNYIMEYVNEVTAPKDDDGDSIGGVKIAAKSDVGDAGAFIGYCEEAEEGITGWISSRLSMSSMSYSYDMFKDLAVSDDGSETTNNVYYYARYGYTLGEMGLDSTSAKSTINIGRFLAGALLMFAYVMSLMVPALFNVVFSILKMINPFRLFVVSGTNYNLMSAADYAAATGSKAISTSNNMWQNFDNLKAAPTALNSVATVVHDWYNSLSQFSWYIIIPLFTVSLLVSIGLLRTSSAWAKGKKLLFRICFLVIGVPVCGALYTFCLDKCADMTSTGNSAATRVVSSVLVDFEAWTNNMRLCPTAGMVIESESSSDTLAGQPTTAAYSNLRKTCQEINAKTGSIPGLPVISVSDDDIADIYEGANLTADDKDGSIKKGQRDNITKFDKSVQNQQKSSGGDKLSDTKTVVATMSLISRYMKNAGCEPGAYESRIKSELSKISTNDKDKEKEITKMFTDVSSSDLGDLDADIFSKRSGNYDGYNIYGNGHIVVSSSKDKDEETGMYTIRFLPGDGDTVDGKLKGEKLLNKSQGLSTQAMYNYLCSSFESSSIVTYSPNDSSSGFVKETHRSVNLIGSGLQSFLYLVNSLTLLFCLIVIGFWYAFGIVFANLRRAIRTITSVPMALLGSLSAIAKFFTYTCMLLIEIIGTIFLYNLVSEFLFSITDIIEAPFVNGITKLSIFKSAANALLMLSILISTIVYIVFTIMAMRLRKSFVKAADEMAQRIIDKFVGATGTPSAPKGPGMAQRAAGAVASGAGMALGNKAMNSLSLPGQKGVTPGQSKADGDGDKPKNDSAEVAKGDSNEVANPDGNVNEDGDGNAIEMSDDDNTNVAVNADGPELESDGESAAQENEEGKAAMAQSELQRISDEGNEDSDAKTDAAIKNATGEVSAVQEEEIKDQEAKDKADKRKEAVKGAVEGTAQTAKGAAEVAAAAETGDAKMAVDGAKDVKEGSEKTSEAGEKAANAGKEAKEDAAARTNATAEQNKANAENGHRNNRTQVSNGQTPKSKEQSMQNKKSSSVKSSASGPANGSKTLAPKSSGNAAPNMTRQSSGGQTSGGRTVSYTPNGGTQTTGKSVRNGGGTSHGTSNARTTSSNTGSNGPSMARSTTSRGGSASAPSSNRQVQRPSGVSSDNRQPSRQMNESSRQVKPKTLSTGSDSLAGSAEDASKFI